MTAAAATRQRPVIAEELSAVRGELSRVDSKCATLAGLAGVAAAFTTTHADHGPLVVRAVAAVSGLAFTAAVLVLLAVLRPRLGTRGFCLYATLTPAQISTLFGAGALDGRVRTPGGEVSIQQLPADDLHTLSQIARRKYKHLRLAVDLMAAGVGLLTAAMVTGVAI